MIVAPCGACTFAPTAWIFPLEMTTVPLGICAPTTGTTVPPRMTYVGVCRLRVQCGREGDGSHSERQRGIAIVPTEKPGPLPGWLRFLAVTRSE